MLTIFVKSSVICVWQGPKTACTCLAQDFSTCPCNSTNEKEYEVK